MEIFITYGSNKDIVLCMVRIKVNSSNSPRICSSMLMWFLIGHSMLSNCIHEKVFYFSKYNWQMQVVVISKSPSNYTKNTVLKVQ